MTGKMFPDVALSTKMLRGRMPIQSSALAILSQTGLSLRQLFIHCKECGMSTLGKEYAILLKTKTKTETRIKTMRQNRIDWADALEVMSLGMMKMEVAR